MNIEIELDKESAEGLLGEAIAQWLVPAYAAKGKLTVKSLSWPSYTGKVKIELETTDEQLAEDTYVEPVEILPSPGVNNGL